ncbi:S-layer homology domain-containing protein [Ureibacillus chungkukjangi]|uniref:S-layer family protein n=1 Tax=Ureibacillus chungkukjangi TaxID=1202712 RepID=A0A318U6L6_9BACL|nr:S-layer homology domain-containing protein [Ureibacillus chungkukjangi]PYF07589.1 S-layer family protein [Ureibacillus chungkukjangi]
MKKITLFLLTFAVIISVLSTTNKASAATDDVSGNYHEVGLRYLIEKGAYTPDANGKYNPNNTITRGQFASFLSKVLNLPAENKKTFSDVSSNNKYYQDIRNAADAGIISGYEDGTFKPNANISRQHMALMLKNALTYMKKGTSTNFTLNFVDTNQILEPYRPAVALGVELGMIHGAEVGNVKYFYPNQNTPVSQASRFILRLMQVAGDSAAIHAGPFKLKEISGGKLVDSGKTSFDFNNVLNAKTKDTQVIVQGEQDKIIYMHPGTGYAVSDVYTTFYSQTVQDSIGTAANTEMQYLTADGKTVKVDLAGQVGSANKYHVTLIPFSLSKGRSYYMNNNGEITHYLVNKNGTATANYFYGKAPVEMKTGVKYYSWNGINFSGGGSSFTYYNYYQFLPTHSKTQYTAEELDKYIDYVLSSRTNGSKSKLKNLGPVLKKIEAEYNVNALMILSLAMHESAYGLSDHAQNLNNLFGLYVYDSGSLDKNFTSIDANIKELLNAFWLKNYVPANASYAHGSVFGTKRIGFNVKYASDPYWGAKAAGHYYRADKYLGFKDANNAYKVGITNTGGLNVRVAPSNLNTDKIYTYTRTLMPVIITDTVNQNEALPWYKVVPDSLTVKTGYIRSDLINVLNTTE